MGSLHPARPTRRRRRRRTPQRASGPAAPKAISTPLPPRTKWTRRVPHPVLIGHVRGGGSAAAGAHVLARADVAQRAEHELRPVEDLWERDETCPVSTEGGTRRVHFVREGGGG